LTDNDTIDLAVGTLASDSVRVVLEGQAASGAYVASPTFSQYGFSWLRDGSFIALAMDAVGERGSAARFHRWVCEAVWGVRDRVDEIVARIATGRGVEPDRMLPTRYALDGTVEAAGDEAWPNFQLDGYGTWLFALEKHTAGRLDNHEAEVADLAARYLEATWSLPCFDYWEEFGDRRHTSTLAAVAAGLGAAGRMLRSDRYTAAAARVLREIESTCVADGAFVKGPADRRVDASLLSLATPFDLVPVDDARMVATVDRVRAELVTPTGGVRRYVGDSYYGGSPWLLLTAWFGWHARRCGRPDEALAARRWVEARAGELGRLAEQDVSEPQDPATVAEWERRWGPVADPLLWSHAMYLLLVAEDRA